MERLQKIIASSGYCSRRKAEELIKKGVVFVNGKKVTELGTKADVNDEIVINGHSLIMENKEYYLLYKPSGVITTTNDDKNRKTVVDLIDTDKRIYPVGRLDYDTTGVLLLTNDGDFVYKVTHPKHEIEKTYTVTVKGIVQNSQMNFDSGIQGLLKLADSLELPREEYCILYRAFLRQQQSPDQ